MSIRSFFKPVSSAEESIPKEWLTCPLPPATKKRCVGRPRKIKDVSEDKEDKEKTSVEDTVEEPEVEEPEVPVAVISTPVKRGKYTVYSTKEKLAILEEAALHGIRPTCRIYKIAPSTLSTWKKQDLTMQRTPGGRLAGGGRKVTYGDERDQEIVQWILEQRELHVPVTCEDIMTHALQTIGASFPSFTASRGWLQKFMSRHDLVLRARTNMSQKLPCDLEDKVSSFVDYVKELRLDGEFEDKFIINMDETPLYFDLVPGKVVDKKGVKSVSVRTTGSDKKHLTVVLAVASDGSVLRPYIIFKGKRELKDIKCNGAIVKVQQKAWVDETMMLDWVRNTYRSFTNRQPSLLVMDSFRAHLTDKVKKELRKASAVTAIIPGGCTPVLQPLDVSINKPFKQVVKTQWRAYIRGEAKRVSTEKKAGNLAAKVKPPSKQHIVDWVNLAVADIRRKPDMVKKSFVVTGINTALNGSDDHMVRQDDDSLNGFFEDDEDEVDFEGFTQAEVEAAVGRVSTLDI